MASNATNIKLQIKAMLDDLVSAGVLRFAIIDDMRRSPTLEHDIPSYPAAILCSPSTDSGYSTNRENMRIYNFSITVIQKGENMQTPEDVEELSEALLDTFDNDPTLSGLADGGVEPSTTTPEMLVTRDKSYMVFHVTLRVHASRQLNF